MNITEHEHNMNIWCSASFWFNVSSSPEECFFTDTCREGSPWGGCASPQGRPGAAVIIIIIMIIIIITIVIIIIIIVIVV